MSWTKLHEQGYFAATIKGSPTKTHALKVGTTRTALCGARPGEPRPGSTHKGRTGWSGYYPDGREPNCPKCLARMKE